MAYLIDTNIAIYARDGSDVVLDHFVRHEGLVLMSALSLAELERGVYKDSNLTPIRRTRLASILRRIPVLPFDDPAAKAYGQIIAQCGWAKGRDFDRMIAGHAISTASTLITDNISDFRDIPGLTVENWAVR